MAEPVDVAHAQARCAVGLAVGTGLGQAGSAAVREALTGMHGRAPDLALLFVSGPDPDEVEAALAQASALTGAATTLGCTATSGLIAGGRGIEGGTGVSVWLGSLPGARLRAFHLEVIRTPETLAVVGMPPARDDDQVCLVLADTWSFPVEGFVDHSATAYPGLRLAGGLAAGPHGAGSTRLLVDGRVVDRGAVGVVVSGDVRVLTAVSQGCRPIGPPMTVTGADGNLVTSLAGRPAGEQLEAVIAGLDAQDQALASRGVQLGIAHDEYVDEPDQGDYVIRGLLGLDRGTGAMAVGDTVEVGQTVRFQLRDSVAADADLVTTLGRLRRETRAAAAAGAVVFSCNGRGTALFAEADHDAATVQGAFPGVPVGGFFAAGEIGPVAGRNLLHGFTASLVVFCGDGSDQAPVGAVGAVGAVGDG